MSKVKMYKGLPLVWTRSKDRVKAKTNISPKKAAKAASLITNWSDQ